MWMIVERLTVQLDSLPRDDLMRAVISKLSSVWHFSFSIFWFYLLHFSNGKMTKSSKTIYHQFKGRSCFFFYIFFSNPNYIWMNIWLVLGSFICPFFKKHPKFEFVFPPLTAAVDIMASWGHPGGDQETQERKKRLIVLAVGTLYAKNDKSSVVSL